MALGFVDNDVVDKHAWDLDLALGERAAQRQALDLDDDRGAEPTGRLCGGQHLAGDCLLLHGDIAILIRRRTAQEYDVERERLEAQPLLAVDGDELDKVLPRRRALAGAELARVDEGVKSCPSDEARPSGRYLARHLRDHALRKRVGLDPIVADELDQGRGVDQRARDASAQHAGMPEVRRALQLAISDADRVNEAKVPRRTGLEEAGLDRLQDRLRDAVTAT